MHREQIVDLGQYLPDVLTIATSPPGSPSNGDRHLVGASATGDFAGQDNKIAERVNDAWQFLVANTGSVIANLGTEALLLYNGTSWVSTGGSGASPAGGANEIQKKSGSLLAGTKIFVASDGDLILGDSGVAGNKSISVISSTTDAGLNLITQGAGVVSVSGSYTSNLSSENNIPNLGYVNSRLIGKTTTAIDALNTSTGPGATEDQYTLVWNNATGEYILRAFDLPQVIDATDYASDPDNLVKGSHPIRIHNTNNTDSHQLSQNVLSAGQNTASWIDFSSKVDIRSIQYVAGNDRFTGSPPANHLYFDDTSRFEVTPTQVYAESRIYPSSGVEEYTTFTLADDDLFIRSGATSGGINYLRVSRTGSAVVISDARNSIGLSGLADYSANYTDLVYTQKVYVDGHINGKNTTTLDALNTSTGPGASEDGFSLVWNNTLGEYVLSNISAGSGNTNLTFSRTATTLTVISDTGSDAILPTATGTLAGVLIGTDKAKLDVLGSLSVGRLYRTVSGSTIGSSSIIDNGVGSSVVIEAELQLGNTSIAGDRSISVESSAINASLNLTTKGTGVVKVPAGYTANISAAVDLVNKEYSDGHIGGKDITAIQALNTSTGPGANENQYVLTWDNASGEYILSNIGLTDGDKGDVTVSASGATWTIDNTAVTFAKMQNVATATILGRTTASTGSIEALTVTQARTVLDVYNTTYIDGHINGKTTTVIDALNSSTGPGASQDGHTLAWDNASGEYILVAGSGGAVSISGTPTANQLTSWVNSSTIQGIPVTYASNALTISNAITAPTVHEGLVLRTSFTNPSTDGSGTRLTLGTETSSNDTFANLTIDHVLHDATNATAQSQFVVTGTREGSFGQELLSVYSDGTTGANRGTIRMGSRVTANVISGIGIGHNLSVLSPGAICISPGRNVASVVRGSGSIGIGDNIEIVDSEGGVVIGSGAKSGGGGTSIGESAGSLYGPLRADWVAIGTHASGSGSDGLGIGAESVAVGHRTYASSTRAGAFGSRVGGAATGAFIIGYRLTGSTFNGTQDSIGFVWDSTAPTTLFAKSTASYINNTVGLVIGDTSLSDASILELESTTKGFVLTRQTNPDTAITGTQIDGLISYDTTDHHIRLRRNGTWDAIADYTYSDGHINGKTTTNLDGLNSSTGPGASEDNYLLRWNNTLGEYVLSPTTNGNGITANGLSFDLGGTITADATVDLNGNTVNFNGTTTGSTFNSSITNIASGLITTFTLTEGSALLRHVEDLTFLAKSELLLDNNIANVYYQNSSLQTMGMYADATQRLQLVSTIPDREVLINTADANIRLNPGGNNRDLVVVLTASTPGVFRYEVDGSANYVARSITDVGYVDSHINGKDTTTIDALNTSTGPGAGQDGYALTWSNSAGEYILTDVSSGSTIIKDGTPANTQLAGWTSSDNIRGISGLTYDDNDLSMSASTNANRIIANSSGNTVIPFTIEARGFADSGALPIMTFRTNATANNRDIIRIQNNNDILLRVGNTETQILRRLSFGSGAESLGLRVKTRTTAERDLVTAGNGDVIYNASTSLFEFREGGSWISYVTYSDTHINGKTTTTLDALNTSTGPGASEDGYSLTWNNTAGEYVLSSVSGSSAAAGADRNIQFNDSGSFGVNSNFNWTSSNRLQVLNYVESSPSNNLNLNSPTGQQVTIGLNAGTQLKYSGLDTVTALQTFTGVNTASARKDLIYEWGATADNAVATPLINHIARRSTPASIANRTILFAWSNHTTQLMTLGVNGELTVNGNVQMTGSTYVDTHLIGKTTTVIDALNSSTGPGATENGYALTWNNSSGEYVLSSLPDITATQEAFNTTMTFDRNKSFSTYTPSGAITLSVDDPNSSSDTDFLQEAIVDGTSLTSVAFEANKFYIAETSQFTFNDVIGDAGPFQIWFTWQARRQRVIVSIFKITVLS